MKERRSMKILELEERYRRLHDELVEATRRISRIAADQETSPVRVRVARERADELKQLTRRARIDLALALSAEGIPAVQIAGRIGTTLASVNDMLALGSDSVIED
jgi:chromosome segregation ATPase